MRVSLASLTVFLAILITFTDKQQANGQQYDDYNESYEQDNLYADYAARQQEKNVPAGGGGGFIKFVAGGTVGWLVGGKFHSSRVKTALSKKHKEEQKALYQQYYNDVYTLQSQNTELVQALEKIQKQRR